MDTAQTLRLTFKVSPMKKETKLVLQQAHCLKKIPCAYSVVDAGGLQHCLQRAGRCECIELAGQGLFSHYREPSQVEKKKDPWPGLSDRHRKSQQTTRETAGRRTYAGDGAKCFTD